MRGTLVPQFQNKHSITYTLSPLMILRSFYRLPTVLLSVLLLSVGSSADDSESFNCQVTGKGVKFDLTPLAGGRTVNQTRNTPPTTTTDSLRFDLCDDLKQMEGIPEGDQVFS
jgi:hypothetical protein